MAKENITTQQRMLNFAAMTRQNMHEIGKQSTNDELSTLQFNYPKTRLLSKTMLKVDVDLKLKHASKTELKVDNYNLAKILRKITQDLNTGFKPVVLSGEELMMFNTVATHPAKITSPDGMVKIGDNAAVLTASSAGTDNKYTIMFVMENTINSSMLQGMFLLQNNATQVNLTCDIGNVSAILGGAEGFTAELNSVTITPMITTFTIPSVEEAFPDISVLKLMHAKTTSFNSGGDNVLYLDTGTIYRKLLFYITDLDGNPLKPSDINGHMELAFNTADIPYSLSAEMIQFLNADQFGQRLRDGLYVWDFSSQSPLIGFGGSRDYIDTERLTQFTFKLNTNGGCKVTTIAEMLTRLQ